MRLLLCLFLFPLFLSAQNKQAKEIPFSYKDFLNLANFFDSKQEVMHFFDFKAGDVIADVGAGSGKYEGAFSLLYDSLSFYIQDIDRAILNQAALDKMVSHYTKLKGKPLENIFQLCLGTEKSSGLPDASFDKILILSAFHEFTFMDEMIDDLSKKLKPGGKVYIMDASCYAKNHVNYKAEEVISKMKAHGFSLQSMDDTNKHGSEGMYKAVFYR